jgi:hypothetical protein
MSDQITVAVIGLIAGLAGSIPGTVLTHHLTTRRETKLDRVRRRRLRALLEDSRWKWRSMDTLRAAVGCDEATTSALLLEIGASRSMETRDMWTLRADN